MATELVSFEVQKLWDLLSQEYQQFQGVDDQVTKLKSDLNLLKSFLKDADAKKHTSAMVRNCMEEIKEIVYDAEDIIETFLLKKELQKGSGFKMRLRRLAFPIVDRGEIASNMEGISTRISKVIQDMKSFGVQQIVIDGGYMQPLHDRQREIRQTYPSDHEIKLVGLEENVEKLVGFLVEEDCFQVVSITGMDGIGKTTLARQVFNHDMVKNQFDKLAWVCVSQDFTRKHVWETILQNLKPKEEEGKILQMTEPTLQDELFRLLETSRSLIVLDDIWKEEDWDQIKAIFPPKKGWEVVLTSRNESVTGHGDTTYINFKPKGLTIEDSWTLFQSIAFPSNYSSELTVDEEMEELGKKMIDRCRGLPLAVKLLGELLATKYTLHDWKRVYDNIGYHIVGRTNFNEDNNTSVYNVLSVSFEELPSHLKHCFLYLAHFPKDYEIDVEKLSYYWAAEGIPKPRYYEGMTIRDVADGYIEELVMRNMVIAERDINTSRFETCRLHERMREVCMFKAKEENFLHIITRLSSISYVQSPCTSRRIVFQYPDTVEVEGSINNPKIRSFLIMPDMLDYCLMPSSLSFTRLQLLRVLDLDTVEFEGGKLPSSIGKLIHLRYLSLKDAKVFHIPSSLRNLKLLIYLNLDVTTVPISVPNVFMEMHELRYLALPSMIKSIKLKLSNLVNLETLENLSTWNSSLEDLHGMVMLTSLSIIITDETYIENLSAAIRGLKRLEDLSIEDRGCSKMITQRFVLDFIYLKELQLSIYMPRLPEERHFPSNLITISLRQCCLEEDPFPILEKLLHLKEVYLWSRSFSGRRMVCSSSGFPQLRELMFCALEELEEWIVEEGSMPLLHTLHISYCNKLKELPVGLRFIYSLKNMRVGEEWKERLSEGGEDYYTVQHVPSIIFERNIFL